MDTAMDFENTMRFFFGEKAYQIAGSEGNPVERRRWMQKAIRRLMRSVSTLDTTPQHGERLMAELEAIFGLLKRAQEPSWNLVYRLLRLSFRLLGFDYIPGAKCHTVIYVQTPLDYYNGKIRGGGDPLQAHYDRKDALSVKRRLVEQLKDEGMDDFKIALVLNTTEFSVKKLRSGPKRQNGRKVGKHFRDRNTRSPDMRRKL